MPSRSRVPWTIPVVATLLLAVGVTLTVAASPPEPAYLVLDVLVGLACSLVAGLLLSRRPRHLIGRLFAVSGLGLATQAAAGGYAVAAHEFGWPLEAFAFWLTNWVFVVGLAPLLLLALLLPDGRPPSPAWRPVLWLLVALSAALTVVLMFRDKAWAWGVEVDSPIGVLSTDDVVAPAFGFVMAAFAIAGLSATVTRLRRSDDDVRRRMYPVLGAVLAIVVAIAVDLVVDQIAPESPVGIWCVSVALTLLPLSVAVSVLRYRLFEIEVAVRRTLVYVVASALLLAVYLVVVTVVDVPLVGAAVVALAFAPVRAAAQKALAHYLFGDRGDPATALAVLGRSLEDASGAPLDGAARTVAVTLRLPAAQVVDESGHVVSAHGARLPEGVSVPLLASGRREGELLVARRAPQEDLSRADLAVLADLATPLALALAARRLEREVRASRERVVVAREEERRRLRRELHDGLGPGLAAIGLELDLAISRLGADSDEVADRSARRARELTGVLIGDVRRIVQELRPAALDELGLDGALEDLALTPGAGPRMRVEVPPLPALPAATEVAAYRIAQEAVANAVRHASASEITISLAVADGWLCLEVTDDGCGVPQSASNGVGSSSMRERASEVGGRFTRSSRSGSGTVVRAELPL